MYSFKQMWWTMPGLLSFITVYAIYRFTSSQGLVLVSSATDCVIRFLLEQTSFLGFVLLKSSVWHSLLLNFDWITT